MITSSTKKGSLRRMTLSDSNGPCEETCEEIAR